MTVKLFPVLALIGTSFLISACSFLPEPHRIEITQGTVIEQDQVNKLRLGMTREQVKFILGSPSLEDMFNANRWDYIHYVDKRRSEPTYERLIALFQGDVLVKIEGDFEIESEE